MKKKNFCAVNLKTGEPVPMDEIICDFFEFDDDDKSPEEEIVRAGAVMIERYSW